jgi:Na+-transporting methylmalonyl-CoA/oxaloacetate decarboxylase beta subunit
MKKEISTRTITIFTVICALVALISAFSRYLLSLYLSFKFKIDTRDASSIGIIGGADGPTAIFLSRKSSFPLFTVVFCSLVIIKNKKNQI